MSGIGGGPAELRVVVEITRTATGETETFELVGVTAGEPEPETAEDEGEA